MSISSKPRPRPSRQKARHSSFPGEDPQWYKDAIIYECHVRAFHDGNADGIGDFRGLRDKLDYLQDLGVTALWLLPFYVSPLRDDGYDIADYYRVHPHYGTLRDFELLLREAHARGLRVITELVLNHTSDQHPWFQRARKSPPGSPWRDFYVWSDTPDRYSDARIIFTDSEPSNWTWDPVAGAYYWHRFYFHQPDLNFDSPRVREAMLEVVDFWLGMGVDGLRLDAVPYLFEREGTSCENLPETHDYLKQLRAHVDKKFADRMLLAEANQWPEDAAAYFGDGDECHMAFHFPLMPRLFMAARLEDRFPITEILEQTPSIPENCQWAMFLRNHDELTLEMVTDEERDFMNRVFAHDEQARVNLGIRRRLSPLLGHNRRLVELLNALMFSLTGTPVVYYGDEIGMGDNIYLGDRNGVRTPMQWSADKNAGFSRANPQKLFLPLIIDPEYHYEAINVESAQANPSLLLGWMKRIIALRKLHPAFGRGSLEFIETDNRRVLAFQRTYGEERIMVVANLSRFVQAVQLDVPDADSLVPVEMFGRTEFPPIRSEPYFLSLGPHAFFWFQLTSARDEQQPAEMAALPSLPAMTDVAQCFRAPHRRRLEDILMAYIPERRWFGGKARKIRRVTLTSNIPLREKDAAAGQYAVVRIEYFEGEPECYSVPLVIVQGDEARRILHDEPWAAIASVGESDAEDSALLVDGLASHACAEAMLDLVARRKEVRGPGGALTVARTARAGRRLGRINTDQVTVQRGEQSNTSLFAGGEYVLKVIRKVEEGVNPQVEIGRFLTEHNTLPEGPQLVASLDFVAPDRRPSTAAVMETFVANESDAWSFTLEELDRFFETIIDEQPTLPTGLEKLTFWDLVERPLPEEIEARAGTYMSLAGILGQRTAEMHIALASTSDNPAFRPEAYNPFYQKALSQALRSSVTRTHRLLRSRKRHLPEQAVPLADEVLQRDRDALAILTHFAARSLKGKRIRVHGDFHLGQVLYTGKDMVIIDFEGEPAASLGERRVKRSALRDVAAMLRSFDYAVQWSLHGPTFAGGRFPGADEEELARWGAGWNAAAGASFLTTYLRIAAEGKVIADDMEETRFLIRALMLEKALAELGYELENRPTWAPVALSGVLSCLDMP